MEGYLTKYGECLIGSLRNTTATDGEGTVIAMGIALEVICNGVRELNKKKRMLHFVGNGASACMASHMAVDWTKNAGVRAMSYNDVAFLTAIGNDLGYEQCFAQPTGWFAEPGDMLVTISSSGNSRNVLEAISAARNKGLRVVTFSGMRPDNASRRLGDLNLYVPAWTYGMVECAHQVLLHAWLDCFMGVREWELTSPQVIVPPAR